MTEPYPQGTLVEKINSVPGEDGHQDGALATIVRALGPFPPVVAEQCGSTYGYFVEWNDFPGIPVFIGGHRVRPVDTAMRS